MFRKAATRRTDWVRPSGLTRIYRVLLATLLIPTASHSAPLEGAKAGDAERGRAIVANRQQGLCLLCHSAPIPEEKFQGNLAPDLRGTGDRWTEAQLRQRIMDSSALNPNTIMPSYYKATGLARVAPAYSGKTIFTAQQVEDVVAYLLTLREAGK